MDTDTNLTPREKEVLRLVAEDLLSKEIAAQLHICEKTVEFHKKTIRRKIGGCRTAGMTRYAIRVGLINP